MTATVFQSSRTVQFSETDLAGVMHFSNYFRWMEDAEHAFLRGRGLQPLTTVGKSTIGWPRVKCTCDFVRPLRFGDSVDLSLRVLRVGDRSVEYAVDFAVGGMVAARGTVTVACCEMAGGTLHAAAIPSEFRALLESCVDPSAVSQRA
ncbi:MAG: acyl-CoA thioesterase [Planctomycetota bacterium]|jgi:YbgC/YbaW family acyl-CoA thioester hydrolase